MATITKEDGTTLEISKQHIYIVGLKTENNGVTADDVNEFERNLARDRITGDDHEGYTCIHFVVLTDNVEGISEHVQTIPIEQDGNVINDNWYLLESLDLLKYGIGSSDSEDDEEETNQPIIHVVDLKYRPAGSLVSWAVGQPPLYGHKKVYDHIGYVTEEEKEQHKNGVYHFMRMIPQTYEKTNDSKYVPGFMSFHNCAFRKIREKFYEDPYVFQNTYGSNVQKFIETEIESSEDYTAYSTKPGIALTYPTLDPQKVVDFNNQYAQIKTDEKRYNGPLPETAENDEDLVLFNKWKNATLIETKTGHDDEPGLSRHVSFVKVDDRERLHEDRFASLYLSQFYA